MQRGLLPLVLCAGLLGSLPLQPALGQTGGTARLNLDECLRTALENNLDLVSARKDPAIAERQITRNQAVLDGTLSAGVSYNESDGDRTFNSFDTIAESDDLGGTISFTDPLSIGGSYTLSYTQNDGNDFNTQFVGATLTSNLTDSRFTGLTASVALPLLNGFGKEVNTVDILVARGNLEISEEDLRLQAMLTAQSVEDAYWDTLAAREALRISRLALKRAEDLLELNKKKVEVGTLAPIEITEAEAGVAAQVEAVIVSETTLENREDVLLQLMAVPGGSPMWEQSLDLTDRPSYVPVEVDLDEAIATAIDRRPEIISARQRLRDIELQERVSKRRTWHALDLTAELRPSQKFESDDILQDIAPPGPPVTVTNVQESTDWSVGLAYTYKIRNRAAKATYAIAKLNTEKSDLALKNTEQSIRVEVRRSARNLESGLRRVEAAEKNVELQQKKLEAEQKKYDNGMSTSFEVLTFQNDLADAELSQIRAALDYVKSLTALELSKGTLMEARGLSLGP
jgi:outer membrane protein TolC